MSNWFKLVILFIEEIFSQPKEYKDCLVPQPFSFSIGYEIWDWQPLSNCIPSTTSTVVSVPFASSTVITPSLPTFENASGD